MTVHSGQTVDISQSRNQLERFERMRIPRTRKFDAGICKIKRSKNKNLDYSRQPGHDHRIRSRYGFRPGADRSTRVVRFPVPTLGGSLQHRMGFRCLWGVPRRALPGVGTRVHTHAVASRGEEGANRGAGFQTPHSGPSLADWERLECRGRSDGVVLSPAIQQMCRATIPLGRQAAILCESRITTTSKCHSHRLSAARTCVHGSEAQAWRCDDQYG